MLRAPGLGFIMITLALGQIVWDAYRANNLTGGDNGIRHPARPMPFGLDISDAPSFYYFTLSGFAIALFCIWRFPARRSSEPHGHAINHGACACWATCVAGAVAHLRDGRFLGLGRGRALRLLNPPQPHAISLQQSAEILLILGGEHAHRSHVAPPSSLVKNVASTYVERWNTLLGVIFVVVIVFMPHGWCRAADSCCSACATLHGPVQRYNRPETAP
jgi:branched-chain amino acid transport system permease protein